MNSASFRSFITNIYALNTVRGQTLRSFLIMPGASPAPCHAMHSYTTLFFSPCAVQRVPRYRLLLKELLSHTPEEHADRRALEKALGIVEQAATHINEGIRRRENMEKILEVQQDEGVSLVQPSRVFMKEGTLFKLCRRGFKEFTFYLFNDSE